MKKLTIIETFRKFWLKPRFLLEIYEILLYKCDFSNIMTVITVFANFCGNGDFSNVLTKIEIFPKFLLIKDHWDCFEHYDCNRSFSKLLSKSIYVFFFYLNRDFPAYFFFTKVDIVQIFYHCIRNSSIIAPALPELLWLPTVWRCPL